MTKATSDEVIERHAGCCPDPFGGGALLPGKPLERAIQMNVAGMNEAKRLHSENSFDSNREAAITSEVMDDRFTGSPTPVDRNRRGDPESQT